MWRRCFHLNKPVFWHKCNCCKASFRDQQTFHYHIGNEVLNKCFGRQPASSVWSMVRACIVQNRTSTVEGRWSACILVGTEWIWRQYQFKFRWHHEQRHSYQRHFKMNVKNLIEVFDELGNVFSKIDANELFSLDTRTLADKTICTTVATAFELGNKQMENFFKERLQGNVSILKPLHRNKLPLFTFKSTSKEKVPTS